MSDTRDPVPLVILAAFIIFAVVATTLTIVWAKASADASARSYCERVGGTWDPDTRCDWPWPTEETRP